jgi:hypothetical protein
MKVNGMKSEEWIDEDTKQAVVRLSIYYPRNLRVGPRISKEISVRKDRPCSDIQYRKLPNEVFSEELNLVIYDSV